MTQLTHEYLFYMLNKWHRHSEKLVQGWSSLHFPEFILFLNCLRRSIILFLKEWLSRYYIYNRAI